MTEETYCATWTTCQIVNPAATDIIKGTLGIIGRKYFDESSDYRSIASLSVLHKFSMPHGYLLKVLRVYKVNHIIIEFLEHAMGRWNVRLCAGKETNDRIPIKRWIFQGDTLSPPWFCLGLHILSRQLNKIKNEIGYRIKSRDAEIFINHLTYMDDIKLYFPQQRETTQSSKNDPPIQQINWNRVWMAKCKVVNINSEKLCKNAG